MFIKQQRQGFENSKRDRGHLWTATVSQDLVCRSQDECPAGFDFEFRPGGFAAGAQNDSDKPHFRSELRRF